ncbi:MAG TPA: UDP-2,3-diacylglucosamine diphosphatase [Steroidobacteraceae bacterium]|nr:UDP-2,3-diacylglucosamine diphosphatase [Steroidobacteraceae bacterium]
MARGRILFISDLHLDASMPASIDGFIAFLRAEAAGSDALYILGDLFETWIGDDDDEPARARARAALRELTAAGVPCFIQHGNRDFLLGPDFMAASGCRLLPDPSVLEAGGRRFVLSHGDTLCTADRGYQRFRRVVRNALLQQGWRALPLSLRRRFASLARSRSYAHTRRLPESIMDVTPAAVAALLRRTDADVLVHGHTHRPGVHRLDVDGRDRTRIVLGDWPARSNALVVGADGQCDLRTLSTGAASCAASAGFAAPVMGTPE